MSLIEKWKEIVSRANEKGIPVPTARDPKTKEGSVSFSLVVVSAGMCVISILMMLGVAITKLSGVFSINPESMTSIQNAFYASLQFFGACAALYFGRKFQRDGNKVELTDKTE